MQITDKNEAYKIMVEKLFERCREIQTENERSVMRINSIKKITRTRLRDVGLLKKRLDRYKDSWRNVPMVATPPKRKMEKRGPKPKAKNGNEEPKERKPRKPRNSTVSNAQIVTNSQELSGFSSALAMPAV